MKPQKLGPWLARSAHPEIFSERFSVKEQCDTRTCFSSCITADCPSFVPGHHAAPLRAELSAAILSLPSTSVGPCAVGCVDGLPCGRADRGSDGSQDAGAALETGCGPRRSSENNGRGVFRVLVCGSVGLCASPGCAPMCIAAVLKRAEVASNPPNARCSHLEQNRDWPLMEVTNHKRQSSVGPTSESLTLVDCA